MTPHDRLEDAGLFDGPLDDRTLAGWPAWAKEHAAGCSDCQALIRMEAYFAREERSRVEPPSPEELRARLARRGSPPPLGVVLPDLTPFSGDTYRGGALELVRSERGIRGYDPDATHLALFAVTATGLTTVLAAADRAAPGVFVEAEFVPAGGPARVVGLATRGPIDTDLVCVWLDDLNRSGWPERLEDAGMDPGVHVAQLEVRPRPMPGILLVEEVGMAEADPQVHALLLKGQDAGVHGRVAAAAVTYRRALDLAATRQDRTGEIKAAIGLSLSLRECGYLSDAVDLLARYVRAQPFDRKVGGTFARAMTGHALAEGSHREAETWLREARLIDPAPSPTNSFFAASVAHARSQPDQALEALDSLPQEGLKPHLRRIASFHRARALAELGDVAGAERTLQETTLESEPVLEAALRQARAEVAVLRAREAVKGWDVLASRVVRQTLELSQGLVGHAEATVLGDLAHLAVMDRSPSAARRMLLARFGAVADPDLAPSLLVHSQEDRTVVVGPSDARVLNVGRAQLRAASLRAREAVLAGDLEDAQLAVVRELFHPFVTEAPRLLLGHDGVLADLPAAAVLGDGADAVPVLRELVPGVPTQVAPWGRRVASLADPDGDLPGASAEVLPEEADVYLRGGEVRRDALPELGALGLLHVGVHLRRDRGIPELLLSDGPITPAEVEGLRFEGCPVVVLSSCGSGTRSSSHGIERSFASAFLRAGASAVVATRWDVFDHEIHRFVRMLVRELPCPDLPQTMAQISTRLRLERAHPRLWAAPVLYAGP
ncbi:MAG: CHAT domain-containing protein [Myxococcota bacterium]